MSGFHEHTEGREYEVECERCGYTRLLFLPDGGVDLPPCRAPHPHSAKASPAECGGTFFDVKPVPHTDGVLPSSNDQQKGGAQ